MTLDEIIARAGGVVQLAKIAGVHPSTISSGWRRTGKVPIHRVAAVSAALDIPQWMIRPDIWSEPYREAIR